ncbi:Holliday junction resolvase Hjc [Caldisphaera lagunensis]|uniref:Holliday junction resolvase Hjc n=1 Tax=Caldisphaera lagunensis TaxID=200415 RepID=UPI003CCC09C3
MRKLRVKAKATRLENDLANLLWENGFAVVRGPSSGAGVSKRYQPDLIAIKEGKILVIEVKSKSKEGPLYIDSSQILNLLEFAKRANGIPIIAFKLSRKEWRFHLLDKLESTGVNFKLENPSEGLKYRDLEEFMIKKHKEILEFMKNS